MFHERCRYMVGIELRKKWKDCEIENEHFKEERDKDSFGMCVKERWKHKEVIDIVVNGKIPKEDHKMHDMGNERKYEDIQYNDKSGKDNK